MSAYLTLLTPMTDHECLIEAVADMGLDASTVEAPEMQVSMTSDLGDPLAQSGNVEVRAQLRGRHGTALRFLASDTGYQMVVSTFDRRRFDERWLSDLNGRYQDRAAAKRQRLAAEERRRLELERQRLVEAQRRAVRERAEKMGYQVEERRDGETLRMVLVKRTY